MLDFVLIKIEIFEWAKINRINALIFIVLFFFVCLFDEIFMGQIELFRVRNMENESLRI